MSIHRFLLIQTAVTVYKYSFRCIQLCSPRAAATPAPDAAARGARRGRRRHRLHRPGAAAPAVAPSGGRADGGDVVGPDRRRAPAAGAGASVERRDRAARRPRRSPREADVVFLALPDAAAAELAPALVDAGVRVIDLSGAFRLRDDAARAAWYPETHRAARRARLRPHRARARRRRAARGWSPTPAATRPRRCWRSRRWSRPACSLPAPTSSSTPSRACRAPARRRPSGRTSPKCTAACRPTACSTTATAPKSSRASGRDGHVHAAPAAARPRHPRDDLRARRAGHDRRGARRRLRAAPTRGAPFVRLVGSALPEIKHVAHTNFCDIGWRVDAVGPRDPGVGHRQPAEGRVGPGRAEHERDARPRRDGRALL